MEFISLFILAFAVSLDGFGVGITYGLRGIRFPWWSLGVVTVLSATVILVSMGIGHIFAAVLSPNGAKLAGAGILILIGIWAIYQLFAKREDEGGSGLPGAAGARIFKLELKKLGLVIQILKTPAVADMDRSGSISSGEAMLLGLALSMDAFGAGIGASMIGCSALLTAVTISFMSLLFIGIGLKIGHKYAETGLVRRIAYLPGLILIAIGFAKMFS
ncbi:sporulation membrane protein YtaF [Effusibacillus lacus]|uniref:Sporulation membrane protein YtaF n=1 Tax=Effusibacillus lacus TaxID=1348429 RepID=A0A292YGA8_9BACL|nr:sporulation membrane protein YtaF [Effusibacillus lacus]GAX89497.1 sporulation membrane protein YtaF [Effusibacillus lacus]